MSKIKELTPEQEEMLDEQYNLGISIGHSIEPVDHEKATRVFEQFYEKIDMDKPEVVFLDSPYACQKWIKENLKDDSVVSSYFPGQQYAYWVMFYDFCRKIGVKYTDEENELLDLWMDQCVQCHWWWPYERTVVACERPVRLMFDDQNRLHSSTGPAVEYKDGWKLYFWHGTAVKEEWIENPDSVDPMHAINHENIEERRALCEILGWDKILEKLNPTVLDEDEDSQIGKLLEVDLPDHGKQKFLRVVEESTGRQFSILAPENVNTALEAQAEINQIPKELFRKGYVRT